RRLLLRHPRRPAPGRGVRPAPLRRRAPRHARRGPLHPKRRRGKARTHPRRARGRRQRRRHAAPVRVEESAMTPTAEPPADLCAYVLSANPFADNRVNGPGPDDVDADDVHRAAFQRLTGLSSEAGGSRRGRGVVLWGEAGVGKSHLLGRLGRWAEAQGNSTFLYLHNLQASPDGLPRSLLKAVVSILTRGQAAHFRETP